MKKIQILFLLLIIQLNALGQDTIIPKLIEADFPRFDCNHGHICCLTSCKCCPESERYQLKYYLADSVGIINHEEIIQTRIEVDFSQTLYPEDGLIYDQYVGEYIAGFYLADGWRSDTINGGYNKEIHWNPYVESTELTKTNALVAYRFENGKLFTGALEETFTVGIIPDKLYHYNDLTYYKTENLTVTFRANCVNGMLQGRGVVVGNIKNLGMFNQILLAECNFENGEIVGISKQWDLNSIDYELVKGQIFQKEGFYDYKGFMALFSTIEVMYAKGSSDAIKYTTITRNKKTGKIKEKVHRNK